MAGCSHWVTFIHILKWQYSYVTTSFCHRWSRLCLSLSHTDVKRNFTIISIKAKKYASSGIILALMQKSSSNCTPLIRNALIMLSRLDVKAYKRNNRLSVLNVTKHTFYCAVWSTRAAIRLDTTCLVSCLHYDQKSGILLRLCCSKRQGQRTTAVMF